MKFFKNIKVKELEDEVVRLQNNYKVTNDLKLRLQNDNKVLQLDNLSFMEQIETAKRELEANEAITKELKKELKEARRKLTIQLRKGE